MVLVYFQVLFNMSFSFSYHHLFQYLLTQTVPLLFPFSCFLFSLQTFFFRCPFCWASAVKHQQHLIITDGVALSLQGTAESHSQSSSYHSCKHTRTFSHSETRESFIILSPHNEVGLVDVLSAFAVSEDAAVANHCTLLQGQRQRVVLGRQVCLLDLLAYFGPLPPSITSPEEFYSSVEDFKCRIHDAFKKHRRSL